MAEDDTPPGIRPGDDYRDDHQYFGPFGPMPPAEDVWGGPGTSTPGPGFQSHGAYDPSWAPPSPVLGSAGPASGASVPPVFRSRSRRGRLAGLVAASLAAVVLVGGAAGYGGARLADRTSGTSATPSPSSASDDPTVGPSPTATTARPLPPAPGTANTVEVAKRALPSTVMIQVGNGTGSGFVLDEDGRIMTNNHVVAGAADGAKIRVVFAGGKRQSATLVGRSPSYDIAVIKVSPSSALKPMAAGNSDQTEVGQPVIAVGSPLGLPGTVTQGIVSARDRAVAVGGNNVGAKSPSAYINAIQTDAPINPGNSGGPLVDAEARVIGVNSAILTMGSGQSQNGNIGIGFAIPFNQARAVGDQLVKKGKATYPVLGANVRTASGGVQLTSVEDSGPARKAGLRQGDVITKIDGDAVSAMDELIVAIRTRRPGEVVALDYTRDSAKKQVKVTLGSRVG